MPQNVPNRLINPVYFRNQFDSNVPPPVPPHMLPNVPPNQFPPSHPGGPPHTPVGIVPHEPLSAHPEQYVGPLLPNDNAPPPPPVFRFPYVEGDMQLPNDESTVDPNFPWTRFGSNFINPTIPGGK